MPLRSADLAPLLAARPGGTGVGFRQGVIVTWNRITAENTVLVGDSLVENLAILNTSEAAILAAGDVVSILTSGSTWGILGRFTIPGTPEAVTSLSSLRTQSIDVPSAQSTTSDNFTDLDTVGPIVETTVGASGRILVIASAEISAVVARGLAINTAGGSMTYAMAGANTAAASSVHATSSEIAYDTAGTFTADLRLRVAASRVTLRSGLTPGPTILTAKYRRETSGAATFAARNLTVMAL